VRCFGIPAINFLGTFVGRRLLPTITIAAVHWIVAALLTLIALGLGSGLI